jgi:pyruvate/2-oxoacid:ferredoxin oxidoreductase alpha subunit
VIEAIDRVPERGLSVELIAPKMLHPLPDHQLVDFLAGKAIVLCPEVNYSGHFADMLTARYRASLVRVNAYGGVAFRVGRLIEEIEKAAGDLAPATRGRQSVESLRG